MIEHFSQSDSKLLEYLSNLESFIKIKCASQVCVFKPDGGIQLHNIVDMKVADQIFKKKPEMAKKSKKTSWSNNGLKYQ